ncbi:MAG: glycosyl hydrolase [Bacteroidales bacterium]
MKEKICFVLLVTLLSACHHPDPHHPVNLSASPEARQLLEFIYSIQGKYTLAGQHNFTSSGDRYDSIVLAITGKEPAVWGADFSFIAAVEGADGVHHCGPMNLSDPTDSLRFNGRSADELRQSLVDEAKGQHAKGKIITLMWHRCFPTSGDSCMGSDIWAFENRPSKATIDSMTTEGTALNTAWKKQADGVAKYLAQLRDAHIPVLWRPYHEMNGVWFWWCNLREGRFAKLWEMEYRYFTEVHKLNNLLWVWDANAPRDIKGDEAFAYRDFYPDPSTVDILAADVYRSDYQQSHQDELIILGEGKPIALGEVGEVPTDSILHAQPNWTWFMVWGYFANVYNAPEKVKALYDSPRVLTLEEIERGEDGNWRVKK